MTAGKHQPSIDSVANGDVAGKAALFTTFYVDREEASLLYERLRSLAQQTPAAFSSSAQDSTDEPLLERLDLPATHDATAILLILNASGDAATAWETMRRGLREILNAPDLPTVWWGYTVVYQAVLNGNVDMDVAFSKLLPEVRRPHSSESLRRPVAQADVSGGRIWMVDVPLRGDSRAATVLVALSPPDEEKALKSALFGPTLLMADLIAHKGYSIMRDYRGELQQTYKNRLKDFWEASDDLLGDLGAHVQKFGQLDEVTRWYSILTSVVSKFNRMYISMAQQLHNYDRWRVQTEGNDIVEYHYRHLETANRELELLVAEGQEALGVADKALSMARVEVNKAQESNQRVISLLLAVVSAALAGPALIKNLEVDELLNGVLGEPSDLVMFLTRVASIAVLAVLIVALVRLVSKWHGSHLLARGLARLRTAVRGLLEGRRGGVR
jgi:hypothetical protein